MLKDSLIEKNGYLVLDCPYAEFYVPKYYTDSNMAEDCGEYFKCFGLFYVRTFDKINGNPNPYEILKLPSMINLFPDSRENRKMTIDGDDKEDDYIILKFYKGDQVTQSSVTCVNTMPEDFLNLVLSGKIPKNVPYKDVLSAFIKVFTMNKVGMPCPLFTLEMILSEVYRAKGQNELKYGQVLAKTFKPNDRQLDYSTANIRSICKANSSFAGVSFENIDEMMTSAINSNRQNRKETRTPFEDVIKY